MRAAASKLNLDICCARLDPFFFFFFNRMATDQSLISVGNGSRCSLSFDFDQRDLNFLWNALFYFYLFIYLFLFLITDWDFWGNLKLV